MIDDLKSPTRRQLLTMIGKTAGATAMYQAMTSLGFASESSFKGETQLTGAPPGASIVVLGAGLAGLTAAYELRKAGYKVTILEFQNRSGGRCITLRGGDRFTELGGGVVKCDFEEGNYFNPGPWRIPSHHYGVLHYCRKFGVELEPFLQTNDRGYLHRTNHFNGVPQRIGDVKTDIRGYVSELLAKAVNVGGLDASVTHEDQEKLLEGLKGWGVLDKDYRYKRSQDIEDYRGFSVLPAGGKMPDARPSTPIPFNALLDSGMWSDIYSHETPYSHHPTMFQPVGGMDNIAAAFTRECADMITLNAKVTKIHQDDDGVSVTYIDGNSGNTNVRDTIGKVSDSKVGFDSGVTKTIRADWCVCTLPLSVLSQIPVNVSKPMADAISAIPYDTGLKVALEFKRRFWEEDEWIYGGNTYTDMPIQQIAYPSHNLCTKGSGVLLGAYAFTETAYKFNTLTPKERVKVAFAYGKHIHPQYPKEFRSGSSVAWHRMPWVLGCHGIWNKNKRDQHYKTLTSIDNRIVLAGEHCSNIPAWQEGAILSGLDTANRLHKRAKSV